MTRRAGASAMLGVGDPTAAAFRDTIERLHLRLGGAADTAGDVGAWAERTWSATTEGHVCLMLPALPAAAPGGSGDAALTHPVFELLVASPAVTDDPGVRLAPLVLDRGALYLHRWWLAEVRLARALAALDAVAPAADPERVAAVLDDLFPGAERDDGQRVAAGLALERRLAVVTGGPGTGKTTTLARLLVAFLRLRPEARVAFAAPTGKAAARLAQSLASQLPALDPLGRIAPRLPPAGLTVHRLLANLDDRAAGRRGRGQLVFDLVIVDEASMLDVEVAARLAEAIPAHGRLVLAGDRDQLASVEAGAVFSALCTGAIVGLARLERNYRQTDAPLITRIAAALREGSARDALGALEDAAGDVARDLVIAAPGSARRIAAAALAGYLPALDALAAGFAPDEILALFDRYRVLCALRGGEWGTILINRAVSEAVRRRIGAPPAAQWYPGRLVMITRNEPDLGLFNGDVGVCMPRRGASSASQPSVVAASGDPAGGDPGGLAVAFVIGDSPRWFPVLQMPACDDAFAMTVHKSQGSEFDCAAVVPAPAGHPLNSRELLYTAVTRARRRLVLWADPEVIADASARPTTRAGLLAERIGRNGP